MQVQKLPKEGHSPASAPVQAQRILLVCSSAPMAVREALGGTITALREFGVAEDSLGSTELVLAELRIDATEQLLHCHAKDRGLAMPGGNLPAGELSSPDVPQDDLPEGGFGWYLIRTLTQDIAYDRIGDENHTRFRIPIDAAGA